MPENLHKAARIDGARPWRQFFQYFQFGQGARRTRTFLGSWQSAGSGVMPVIDFPTGEGLTGMALMATTTIRDAARIIR
jgi:hypothetical protein